jgi:hypothetical protein
LDAGASCSFTASLDRVPARGEEPTARQAMVKPFPSKTHIGNHMLHPETLMLT